MVLSKQERAFGGLDRSDQFRERTSRKLTEPCLRPVWQVGSSQVKDEMNEMDGSIGGNPRLAIDRDVSSTQPVQQIPSRDLPSLYRRAYRLLDNPADAEDAVQDALPLAYKHLGQLRSRSFVSKWLYSIVSSCARSQMRLRPRQLHMFLESPVRCETGCSLSEMLADSRPSPEDEACVSEMKAWLRAPSCVFRRFCQEHFGSAIWKTARSARSRRFWTPFCNCNVLFVSGAGNP